MNVTVPDEHVSDRSHQLTAARWKRLHGSGRDMVCVVSASVKQPTQVLPASGVGRRDCGRCHGLGTATQSTDERNVARRVESQGTVAESDDDEQTLGPDFSPFQMWSKEAPKCSRCQIMKRYHRTFWTPSCRICSRQRVHHVHCRGLWVGWCWSHSRREARCTTKRNSIWVQIPMFGRRESLTSRAWHRQEDSEETESDLAARSRPR